MTTEETDSTQVQSSDVKSKKAYYAWAGALIFSIVFTFIIWAVGPFLEPFIATLGPDLGAEWYYWKLPAREFMTMLIV
ncbi:MAG: hypothetical protein IH631_01375 [Candidatus Thorarchaeota archaeon]|nr:hypothetical protein [Candidatus Thorarchaeota archaeon]